MNFGEHEKPSETPSKIPLRQELKQVWWTFFLSGLPVYFLAEWAKVSRTLTGFLILQDLHHISWLSFFLFAFGTPLVAVLAIWRKRVRENNDRSPL